MSRVGTLALELTARLIQEQATGAEAIAALRIALEGARRALAELGQSRASTFEREARQLETDFWKEFLEAATAEEAGKTPN